MGKTSHKMLINMGDRPQKISENIHIVSPKDGEPAEFTSHALHRYTKGESYEQERRMQ